MPATKEHALQKVEKRNEYHDPSGVTALIASMAHPLKPTLEAIRQTILSADPAVTEGVKWNSPSFYCHGWFATIGARKSTQIDVVLHCGAKVKADCTIAELIDDPDKLLTWPSKDRALLSFASKEDFASHAKSFKRIIAQWAAYQQSGAA